MKPPHHDDDGYELLDSGLAEKLERFGPFRLCRPCAQAIWPRTLPPAAWDAADAKFARQDGQLWHGRQALPEHWGIAIDGIRFRLSSTDFGHLGVFPEQREQWAWLGRQLRRFREVRRRPARVLNLFAYSGGATMAAALAGAEVCHVDAAAGMVAWARENAALNGLSDHPVRWLVEDVGKFLTRELRRGRRYDGIILDPPSFGRGNKGEIYKIERDLPRTLDACRQLLADDADFLLLSAHTPGLTPVALANLLRRCLPDLPGVAGTRHDGQPALPDSPLAHGEMLLTGAAEVVPVPNGAWARWSSPI